MCRQRAAGAASENGEGSRENRWGRSGHRELPVVRVDVEPTYNYMVIYD